LPKPVIDNIVLAGFVLERTTFDQAQQRAPLFIFFVQASEPGRETLDGRLKLRMEVDKRAQLISEPSEGDLIFPVARLELLDTAISEVHVCPLGSARARRWGAGVVVALRAMRSSYFLRLSERGLHQGTLLLQVNGRGAD
jgi:hypothetical protein